jgi:hypothetical protein
VTVNPLDSLAVTVGTDGGNGTTAIENGAGECDAGGTGGSGAGSGGAGADGGGGGGGGSAVFDTTASSATLVVAGGGGGGGAGCTNCTNAGGDAGQQGGGENESGGFPGTQSGPGNTGDEPGLIDDCSLADAALPGSGMNGGADLADGGGGGGGYYGGGAGCEGGGGGGGSSYPAGDVTGYDSTGTPSVKISYTALATPSIVTSQQPASATVGTSIADKATVSEGDSPSGTVTFVLYNNSTASGTPLLTDSDVALSGGTATSPGYTATATGTDYWVATYNGDTNNNSVTSGAAAEPVSITAATPSIVTSQQPASATVGTSIADKATVSEGDSPSGTVTFVLYSNSSGTGPALFTDADVALSAGVATSTGYTTTVPGTDYWVATYNGDSDNNSVSSASNGEPASITALPPTVTLTSPPTGTPTYTYGQVVDASYSCTAGTGSTLSSCVGSVANGSPINTTTPGTNSFKVTATDADGQFTSVTHTYKVQAASTSLTAWPQLVELEPFVGVGSQIVQATLTSGGKPVSGQTVYFTDGSTQLCHANTNSNGVARCAISATNQALLYRTNHYTATFATTTDYNGSTATTLVVTFIL